MKATYERKVSPVERLFTVIASTDPPFCNTMIVEGTGAFDATLWKKAVDAACEANPGSRLVYKGRWIWSKWVDSGVAAPIRFVDGSKWSGYEPDGAPFLLDPIPFKTSHTSEVLVLNGGPTRIVFRTLHAIMDATGTLKWVHDIFRALRNEPLVGSPSTITDDAFVASLKLPNEKPQKRENCLTPTGPPDGEEPGFTWKRVVMEGKFSKLLPQLALATAKEARKQGAGIVRIAVPHDFRRRVPDPGTTANLSRRFFIDIPPDATIDSIAQQLKDNLANLNGDARFSTFFAYSVPTALLRYSTLSSQNRARRNAFYTDSGTISNGGMLPIDVLRGGGFETKKFFFLPPLMQTKPVFLSTIGYENTLEIVAAMPKALASNGRLEQFISNIVSELNPV
jgi:hypothetical protein